MNMMNAPTVPMTAGTKHQLELPSELPSNLKKAKSDPSASKPTLPFFPPPPFHTGHLPFPPSFLPPPPNPLAIRRHAISTMQSEVQKLLCITPGGPALISPGGPHPSFRSSSPPPSPCTATSNSNTQRRRVVPKPPSQATLQAAFAIFGASGLPSYPDLPLDLKPPSNAFPFPFPSLPLQPNFQALPRQSSAPLQSTHSLNPFRVAPPLAPAPPSENKAIAASLSDLDFAAFIDSFVSEDPKMEASPLLQASPLPLVDISANLPLRLKKSGVASWQGGMASGQGGMSASMKDLASMLEFCVDQEDQELTGEGSLLSESLVTDSRHLSPGDLCLHKSMSFLIKANLSNAGSMDDSSDLTDVIGCLADDNEALLLTAC